MAWWWGRLGGLSLSRDSSRYGSLYHCIVEEIITIINAVKNLDDTAEEETEVIHFYTTVINTVKTSGHNGKHRWGIRGRFTCTPPSLTQWKTSGCNGRHSRRIRGWSICTQTSLMQWKSSGHLGRNRWESEGNPLVNHHCWHSEKTSGRNGRHRRGTRGPSTCTPSSML